MMAGIRTTLFTLAGLQAPQGTLVAGLQFQPHWLRLALWLVLVLAGLALSRWIYHHETIRPKRGLKNLLVTLRVLAVASLAWLVLTPIGCSAKLEGETTRAVAVVLDDSRSMAQIDLPDATSTNPEATAAPSRLEQGRALLGANAGALAQNIAAKAPIRFFSAGDTLRTLDYSPQASTVTPWDNWQAIGSRTALGEAITELVARQAPPGAIVVFTDGRQNSGPDLPAACKAAAQAGIEVHLVALGAPEPAAIFLRDLELPEVLQVGEKAVARARLRAVGVNPDDTNEVVEVTAEINGVEVATERVTALSAPGAEQTISLAFVVPGSAGDKTTPNEGKIILKARLTGSTRPTAPGRLERAVRLTDKPARILLIDGVPRWDFRFLLMQLVREAPAGLAAPDTQKGPIRPAGSGVAVLPSFVLLTGDKNLVTQEPFLPALPPRDELMRFDAIWLGDVEPNRLGPDGAETIRRFVEEGGGLILQAGPSFQPRGWIGTPLAELLPIEPDLSKTGNPSQDPFHPQLTSEGFSSDVLRLADTAEASRRLLQELPGIQWNAPVNRLKPGARMLLSHPTRRCATGLEPLLATQSYGRGRVAWLGTDETWRWRKDTGDTHFARFWTQWLVWAAASRSNPLRRVRLSIDKTDSFVGQTGELRARVLDSTLAPDGRARLPAEMVRLSGPDPAENPAGQNSREVELRAVAGQRGEFALTLVHDQPGRFKLRLPGDDGPGVEWTVVAPPDPEGPGGMAEGLLREAAKQAGTALLLGDDAMDLPQRLNPGKQPWRMTADLPKLHPIWFVLLVAALGLEWALRRQNQMS